MNYKFMVRVSGDASKQEIEEAFPGASVLEKLYDDDCAFVTDREKTSDVYDKLDKLKNKGYNILSVIRVL